MHGEPLRAFLNQPMGFALFLLALFLGGTALAELVAPRDRWRRLWARVEPVQDRLALGLLLGLLVAWGWKLWIYAHGWVP